MPFEIQGKPFEARGKPELPVGACAYVVNGSETPANPF
jgi:hypothetical protein